MLLMLKTLSFQNRIALSSWRNNLQIEFESLCEKHFPPRKAPLSDAELENFSCILSSHYKWLSYAQLTQRSYNNMRLLQQE